MVKISANNGDPYQMRHYVVSDLGLHCLLITLFGVSILKWVKGNECTFKGDNCHTFASLQKKVLL